MAVYAPGDDDGSGSPTGTDPNMWARLMGYINPIGSANAAPAPTGQVQPLPQGGNGPRSASFVLGNRPVAPQAPFQGPGTQSQSGGWPVNQAGQPQYATGPINQALASGPGNTNTPAILPHLTGDGPNVQGRPVLPYLNPNTAALANTAAIPTNLPPQGTPMGHGGIGSDANAPVMGAGGFPTTYAAPGQQPAMPTPSPAAVPYPPPRPRVAAAPVRKPVRIPASATALAPPAAAAPGMAKGWTTDTYQNRDFGGGALARGGTARMGMLDLSQLFGQR